MNGKKQNNKVYSLQQKYYEVMSKLIYSDMTFSILPGVDLAGEDCDRPRSDSEVSGLDSGTPGITSSSSWTGGSGITDATGCKPRVLLLVLIGEGDCRS